MILPKGHATKYLTDFKDGKIKRGLGIDTALDEYLLFKPKQLCIVLGHDNVGKSYFMEWYFLVLALKHDLKFTLWMGENNSGQVMRDLIQMYVGIKFDELTHEQIRRAEMKLEYNFTFVDNSRLYTPDEMLAIFQKTDSDVCFIDPFTGLDRGFNHSDNYEFLNKATDQSNLDMSDGRDLNYYLEMTKDYKPDFDFSIKQIDGNTVIDDEIPFPPSPQSSEAPLPPTAPAPPPPPLGRLSPPIIVPLPPA